MTDADYYARFHTMMVACLVPRHDGRSVARRIVDWAERRDATADDQLCAAKALRDIFCAGPDETRTRTWTGVKSFRCWLEPSEGVPYALTLKYGGLADG